jgi:hypothetical protein
VDETIGICIGALRPDGRRIPEDWTGQAGDQALVRQFAGTMCVRGRVQSSLIGRDGWVIMDSPEPAKSLDPAAVNTPGELAECLNALHKQRGLSYEAMDRAALRLAREGAQWHRLGKTTVGEIVNGERLPTLSALRTFLAVCGVRPGERAAWEAAFQRASTVRTTKPSGAIRVRRAQPRRLGVHAVIRSTEGREDLPTYIPRDLDAGLRATLVNEARVGGLVMLIGRSSVGKTRSLFEAMREIFQTGG